MELWTRRARRSAWMEWPSVLQALASLQSQPEPEVLLLSEAPDAELAEITAALRLVRQLVPHAATVIVASPHPSSGWRVRLHDLGVDHLWLVESAVGAGAQRPPPTQGQEIDKRVCPALHAQTRDGRTLSVCGRHEDRLVLASRHMTEWCLGNHRACPHWRNGKRA